MAAMRQDFLDFFAAEFDLVARFVVRHGAELDEAQDIAQYAFIRGWYKVLRGEWEQIDHPRAWIRTVAIRHHQRVRCRARSRAEITIERLPEAAMPGPGHAELTGQARDLVAALRLLDEDARTVLAFHLDDISTCDIAVHMGVSQQKVRDLLQKARRTLKKHLPPPKDLAAETADKTGPPDHEGRRQP